MAKKWVVYAVSEENTVSVYGPYSKQEADDVMEQVYHDDSGQKVYAEAVKPELYVPQVYLDNPDYD